MYVITYQGIVFKVYISNLLVVAVEAAKQRSHGGGRYSVGSDVCG